MTGDSIEKKERRVLPAGKNLRQRADLQIPMGAVNLLDVSKPLRSIDEFSEIIESHIPPSNGDPLFYGFL